MSTNSSMTYENGTTMYFTSSPVVVVDAPTTPPPGTLPPKSVTANARDTCGCYDNGNPRSCRDCLNVQLQSGDRCVVTPLGACMSETAAAVFEKNDNYSSTAAVTSDYSVIPQSNEYFPSSNTTYCDYNDATCTACRLEWVGVYRNNALRSEDKFACIGPGGCVCTAYCELRSFGVSLLPSYKVGQETCLAQSWSASSGVDILTILNSCAFVLGAFVLVLAVRWGVQTFHKEQSERRLREERLAQRQRNATGRFGIALSLVGWTGYRNELIEREQASFGLKSEPLLTDAPTRVVIEEGAGFRPASPSQLSHERTARLS